MNKYIDSEIILTRKIKYFVYVYILIIIIITLSLITMSMIFNYKLYYKVKAIVTEDNYLKVYMPLDDIKYILKNDYLFIDNKKYKYNIKEINKEYLTDNKVTYQAITLELSLPSEYKYHNLTLDIKLIKEDKKIIDYILRRRG